jgi:thymidylate synthase
MEESNEMIVLQAHDPDMALEQGITLLMESGQFEKSRAGEVLVSPRPVTTQWNPSRSLASLNPIRDANPFFHLNEAIWMLQGDNDGTVLDAFVSDFSHRFGEPDGSIHGAYGYRWRHALGFDQLEWIIDKLKSDPTTRQCVLQMWDGTDPHHGGASDDLKGNWKDRPCNTHVYFRVDHRMLDMTVCCRSNDMIWGAYGANIVHFGVLHEYVAALAGLQVGFYYQISNNFHSYTNVLGPMALKMQKAGLWDRKGTQARKMELFNSPSTIELDRRNWGDNDHPFTNNLFKFAARANQVLEEFREKGDIGSFYGEYNWDWAQACRGWLHRRRK